MASGSLTLLLLLFSLGCSNAASTGERGEDPTLGPADCVQIEEHGCCWENYWWDDATNETETASARWPATTAASRSGSTSGTITCAAAQNHAWEAAAEKVFNRRNILLLKILLDMLDVKFLLK